MSGAENALWNETGSRGDAFRSAMRGRAEEAVRVAEAPAVVEIDGPTGEVATAFPPGLDGSKVLPEVMKNGVSRVPEKPAPKKPRSPVTARARQGAVKPRV